MYPERKNVSKVENSTHIWDRPGTLVKGAATVYGRFDKKSFRDIIEVDSIQLNVQARSRGRGRGLEPIPPRNFQIWIKIPLQKWKFAY